MSSVGSSDRRADDAIRKTREEYQNRESEQVKKNKKNTKAASAQHNKEIETLKAQHAEQMESLRNKTRESLSEKDRAYQDQIQDVRNMYQEQMRRKSDDSESLVTLKSEESKQMLAKERASAETQKERLKKNHEAESEYKTKIFQESMDNARKEVKETVQKRSQIQGQNHQKEMNALVNDRDERVGGLQRSLEDTRRTKESEIKDLKRQNAGDKERMSNAMTAAVIGERAQAGAALSSKDKLLQMERLDTQKKFSNKLKEINDQTNEIREQLKEDVNGRFQSQVRSQASDNANLRAQLVHEKRSMGSTQQVEKKHLIDAYEDRLHEVENRSIESAKQVGEQARRNVNQQNEKNEKLLKSVNQFHEGNLEIANVKHQGDRIQLERESKNQQDSLKKTTDRRVKGMIENFQNQGAVQSKYYEESKEALAGNYQKALTEIRSKHMQEVANLTNRMENRVKQAEEKFTDSLDQTKERYEKEIALIEKDNGVRMKDKDISAAKKLEDRENALKMEIANQELKYQAKLVSQKEAHDAEIDRMNKRQTEEVNNLVARMSYSRKS